MKTIKDPTLDGHYIQVDDYNYSSYETKTSKEGKEYSNLLGHYPNINLALESIIHNITRNNLNVSNTLPEYISQLESSIKKIQTLKLNK